MRDVSHGRDILSTGVFTSPLDCPLGSQAGEGAGQVRGADQPDHLTESRGDSGRRLCQSAVMLPLLFLGVSMQPVQATLPAGVASKADPSGSDLGATHIANSMAAKPSRRRIARCRDVRLRIDEAVSCPFLGDNERLSPLKGDSTMAVANSSDARQDSEAVPTCQDVLGRSGDLLCKGYCL